jgi:hypothetical protein
MIGGAPGHDKTHAGRLVRRLLRKSADARTVFEKAQSACCERE